MNRSFEKARRAAREFSTDQDGATLVEFALVLTLFLLIFFGLIDFGRLAFHYVTTERAMQVAARVAAVRPPACATVPEFHARPTSLPPGPAPDYGTSCNAGPSVCINPGTITCAGASANTTAAEIWALVRGTLPKSATIANLSFSYSYDSNLGFLGGPYVPVVTVELQSLNFDFISPLGVLVGLTGGTADASLGASITFPSMSVSLPAEDLSAGNNG